MLILVICFVQIKQTLGLSEIQVPIDACATANCYGDGCISKMVISEAPVTVNADANGFAGVNIKDVAVCICGNTDYELPDNPQKCDNASCANGGTCRQTFGDIV